MSPAQDAARLYERYARDLYRYCLAQLRSPEEAEDAVQNTFMRAFRALDAGVVTEFESAWLYRIATNVCLSRRALTGRRAQWQSDDELEQLPVPAPEVDPEAARELIDAVAALPKNQRDAILLREWRGLSYAEIADSLHTTVPAVENLLVRARRQLVSLLRPRRRTQIIDGMLLLRLRSWFAAASPAHLAAGAAVVALGGTVAGANIGAADITQRAERTAIPATASEPHDPAVLTPHRTEIVTRRRLRPAPSSGHRAAMPVTPGNASPPPSAPPTPVAATTPQPPPHTEPPAAPAARISSTPTPAPTTTTTAQMPLAYVAPVTAALPTVAVPAVTVPAVTLPASPVSVPSLDVTVPAVTVPEVTAPAVTVAVPLPAISPPPLPSGLLP